jgi:DNA-binding response OmpR family regulator
VILDLMIPGLPGMTLLRRLREGGFAKPILILTALDSVEDRVQGLDEGADDYLVKPFAFAELLARLRVMLRREPIERLSILRAENLEMNRIANRVTRGGVVLDLTAREYQLLEYLLLHKNEPVTRGMIAADVWKEKAASMTNVIEVYINALRKKIERPEWPPLIRTVRGVGYEIRCAPADEIDTP